MFVKQLQGIFDWQIKFNLNYFKLISSSILFVYGREWVTWTDPSSGPTSVPPPLTGTVKMIDFAHVVDNEDGEHDENYIGGLSKLIKHFKMTL